MSWYSKVFWSEGLFLRPHHLQQNDRYIEHLLEKRVRYTTPYPWGFAQLEIDKDLTEQSKFAVRNASGVMPDGTPFDVPGDSCLGLGGTCLYLRRFRLFKQDHRDIARQ